MPTPLCRLLRLLSVLALVAVLAGGGILGQPRGAAAQTATTTTALNLRAKASTSSAVKLVMPAGASVEVIRRLSNGFYRVVYRGVGGYAHGDYLSFGGNSGGNNGGGESSGPTGTARTTDDLNLRSGPSTADRVLLVMPSGARVTLNGRMSNGFASVTYQGTTGWASTQYLSSGGGSSDGGGSTDPGSGNAGTAYTTTALNLRAGPSTSDRVLLVMPSGAAITLTGTSRNGFLGVSYNGTRGWASEQYITTSGGGGGGGASIVWPFASGGSWTIIQGYNGGTHNGTTYRYSLDLAKTNGSTAGTSILSPVSGTVLWNDVSSGGLAIDIGNGYTLAMFHVTFSGDLTRGTWVSQGQWLGTISGPGGPGYQATPHVDMTLWASGRVSTPFSGGFAISGQSFEPGSAWNLHGGTVIYP